GQELVQAAAAVDVHDLGAEADAKGWRAATLDLGHQRQVPALAVGVDALGFLVPLLTVERGVQIVAAAEEHAVDQVHVLGNEGEISLVREQQRQSAGEFDRL